MENPIKQPSHNQTFSPAEASLIDEGLNLRHYWHIILERRWLVIAAFVSVVTLCAIYLARAPRVYQATARLQIDREAENFVNIRDAFALDGREQDYLQTQYKNLTTRLLIQKVIGKCKLDTDPRYASQVDRVKAVLNDISVIPIRMSRLVDVRVEHTNPKQATNIANTLLTIFVDENLDQKLADARKGAELLDSEVSKQQSSVEAAEKALQDYKRQIKNISVEDSQNIILLALKQANEQYTLAQSKASMAKEMSLQVKSLIEGGLDPESIPPVMNDKLIQDLKARLALDESELDSLLKRYKDEWPAVKQKRESIASLKKSIKDGVQRLIQAVHAEAEITHAQEESQKLVKEKWEAEQLALGEKRLQFEELTRQADLKRKQYLDLLKSQEELKVNIRTRGNNMRVRDPAVEPDRPVKPRVTLTLVLGFLGGLLAGSFLAFFVNYLDDSIKTQEDVEVYLRLPFLGYVPNIKSNSVIERDLQAHVHPQSTAAEGFRTIRAAIALMPKSDQYRLVSVTSTIPSEGKSLLASNLAIVTAQTGVKTLLVDADLRRPSVHKTFQLHSPIGLSAYLLETASSLEEITHTTEVPNLDVICAGAIPSNPSELSGSKKMRQFLQEVMKRYDRVFLDCPPVSAVSDPLIIAAMSDGVIFVTKFNKIRREHARKSVQRIQDAGIRLMGVVLNDIDFEGKDSYYYSYYYYQNRYYASHYKTKPELPHQPEASSSKS